MKAPKINKYWHNVYSVKDMPKKSGSYLMLTNMGWPLTFYWSTHKRQAFVYSNRNHFDSKKNDYVDDGKVDCVKISLKHPGFAWGEVPKYYLSSKKEVDAYNKWFDEEINKSIDKLTKEFLECTSRITKKHYCGK